MATPLGFDPIAEARRQWDDHGWDNAAAGMAAVTSVIRVNQLLLAAAHDAVAPFGLTFSRYEVLRLLAFTRRGALPLGKIGARLQVHAASVTNAVDRLESDDLVRRDPHPTDRRTVLAAITPKGTRVVAKATTALNTAVFESLPLSVPELDQLFDLLRRFRLEAGDFSEPLS
jgi:DNA-binding MarR family transcriptional regulator